MSMISRPSGRLRLLAAGVTCAAALTACGGDGEDDERSDPGSKEAAASSERAEEPDLASGLLTDEDFGPDAVVAAVSPEQLQEGAGIAAQFSDVQIAPESCAAAVEGTQPDLTDFDDIAAVSATVGSTVTVEMVTRGGPVEGAVDQLAGAVQRCPQAQVSSPEIGTATVTFEEVPVADLGDGSAALRYTTVVALPDGTQASVPALIGAVQDGDRLVILTTLSVDPTGAGAALDAAVFASLFERAYETQADALD